MQYQKIDLAEIYKIIAASFLKFLTFVFKIKKNEDISLSTKVYVFCT